MVQRASGASAGDKAGVFTGTATDAAPTAHDQASAAELVNALVEGQTLTAEIAKAQTVKKPDANLISARTAQLKIREASIPKLKTAMGIRSAPERRRQGRDPARGLRGAAGRRAPALPGRSRPRQHVAREDAQHRARGRERGDWREPDQGGRGAAQRRAHRRAQRRLRQQGHEAGGHDHVQSTKTFLKINVAVGIEPSRKSRRATSSSTEQYRWRHKDKPIPKAGEKVYYLIVGDTSGANDVNWIKATPKKSTAVDFDAFLTSPSARSRPGARLSCSPRSSTRPIA